MATATKLPKSESNHREWTVLSDTGGKCRVFSSFKDPQACGCELPLAKLVDRVLQHSRADCPVCQSPIAFIQEVSYAKDDKRVIFKYGKHTYELAVGEQLRNPQPRQAKAWWQVWWYLGGLGEGEKHLTAQGRIMSTLGMREMKILSKGKVVYPSHLDDMDVSKQLIELSNSSKVSLLIMGTLAEQGHTTYRLSSLWAVPIRIGQQVLITAFSLLRTVLQQLYGVVRPLLTRDSGSTSE